MFASVMDDHLWVYIEEGGELFEPRNNMISYLKPSPYVII